MKRLFIAVSIPDKNKEEIAHTISHLTYPRVTWTEPSKWHLTLVFLGEKHQEDVDQISRSLGRIATNHIPFSYQADTIKIFGHPKTPRLVMNITPNPSLMKLQRDVAHILHVQDPKPFVPHITIGKLPHTKGMPHTSKIQSIPFEAREVQLIHSMLLPHGSEFYAVASFLL